MSERVREISIDELHQRTQRLLKGVTAGRHLRVTAGGKAVADVVPPGRHAGEPQPETLDTAIHLQEAFWSNPSPAELAADQGVGSVHSVEGFASSAFADEDPYEIAGLVRQLRRSDRGS